MPFSYEEYDGDGLNRVFSVPFPYILQQHVSVTVGGTSVPFTWLNPSQVQMITAPAVGTRNVQVRRTTPGVIATLSSPSIFRSSTLNTIFRTLLYVSQEGADAGMQARAIADRAVNSISSLIVICVSAALTAVNSVVDQGISAAGAASASATSASNSAVAAAASASNSEVAAAASAASVVAAAASADSAVAAAASAASAVAAAASNFNPSDYALAAHSHGVATGSVAGFMSTTDKTKLDGLSQGYTATNNGLTSAGVTVGINTNNALGVGAYAFLYNSSGSPVASGGTAAGSGLRTLLLDATPYLVIGPSSISGTWRNISGVAVEAYLSGLFIRTA